MLYNLGNTIQKFCQKLGVIEKKWSSDHKFSLKYDY